jgi:hypothetical protein
MSVWYGTQSLMRGSWASPNWRSSVRFQSGNGNGGSYRVGIQPSDAMNIKTDALDAKHGSVTVKTGVGVRAVSP